MAQSNSQKNKNQMKELIIFLTLLLISAGLITAMVSLYIQRRKQADQSGQNQQTLEQETTETTEAVPESTEIQTAPAETTEPETTAESTTETVPETTTEPVDENLLRAEEIMQEMSLEEKIYQLFIVTPEVLVDNAVSTVIQTGSTTKDAIENKPVSGVIYFSQNMQNADQTRQMITDIQEHAQSVNQHIGLWIGVDEEGGTVARVADNLGTTTYEDMAAFGERNDKEEVLAMGEDIAEDIAQFGFNLDFAPVADVYLDEQNELQDRIFSDDPDIVSDLVSAMVQGLQNSGEVSATLKHFPGLGAENGNTHEDAFTYIDRSYDDLDTVDFLPFRSGIEAGADFVMVGHQIMSCAEDDLPSDLSSVVITDWLRGNLGFEGIVITDAHNMNTITENYSSGEAALLAIQAGADIILMPDDLNDAFQTIYDAVEEQTLSEERIDESVRRILTAKARHHLL